MAQEVGKVVSLTHWPHKKGEELMNDTNLMQLM
jgi:hypothetical protein